MSAAEDIKCKGVEEIVCMAVNDPFVMEAWGQAHKATGKVGVRLFCLQKKSFFIMCFLYNFLAEYLTYFLGL